MKKPLYFLVLLVFAILTTATGCSNPTALVTADVNTSIGDEEITDEIRRDEPEQTPDIEVSDEIRRDEPEQSPDVEITDEIRQQEQEQTPDDESVDEPDPAFIMPEYEILQTLYQEIRADDGVLLARNEYYQPVFIGNNAPVIRMNEAFENDLAGVNMDDFDYLPDMYDSREGYVYDEAQYGRVGGYVETWAESFRLNEYISFAATGDWDGLGAHGGFAMMGRTFDASTGDELTIADMLTIAPDRIQNTLYKEYIVYHYTLGDGFDKLARGSAEGLFENSYIDSVKEQCGENAVFWLADDGIHIFFHQYTFYYAVGMSELVIPYTRFDLIRAPFAGYHSG